MRLTDEEGLEEALKVIDAIQTAGNLLVSYKTNSHDYIMEGLEEIEDGGMASHIEYLLKCTIRDLELKRDMILAFRGIDIEGLVEHIKYAMQQD